MSYSENLLKTVVQDRRNTALEKLQASRMYGHWAVLYASDKNGIQVAFHIRLDQSNRSNFPRALVESGKLDSESKRQEWQANDVIEYFDGQKVATATFFRHCHSKAEIEEAEGDCSAMLHPRDGAEYIADSADVHGDDPRENSIECDGEDAADDGGRMVGKSPNSAPLNISGWNRQESLDPDYVPETVIPARKKSRLSPNSTKSLNSSVIDTIMNKTPDDSVSSMLLRLENMIQSGFQRINKDVAELKKTVTRLTKNELGCSTVSRDGMKSETESNVNFGSEFFSETEFNFVWMGVDVRSQLNRFLSKQSASQKCSNVIRSLLRQFWGVRNLRYWLLTDAAPNKRKSRPRLESKDEVGYEIYKHAATRIVAEMKLCRQRALNQHNIENEENVRSELLQSSSIVHYVLDQGAQLGRDAAKGKEYLATGDNFRTISDSHGVSKSTLSRAVHRFVAAVNTHIYPDLVDWPADPDQLRGIANEFNSERGMPCVFGCVDGSLIQIIAPSENEEQFVDRHQNHSLNTMLVCGPTMRFYYVSSRWPGSVHDARVFRNSTLKRRLENGWRPIPLGVLLGDSAYPDCDYLVTPVADPVTRSERRYNKAHRRTRNLIECAIGILKQRFRCLLRGMHLQPLFAAEVIRCCATLHNLLMPDDEAHEELEEFEREHGADDDHDYHGGGVGIHGDLTRQRQLIALF